MKKAIFCIPGFKTQITDPQYVWLVSYLKNQGYEVIAVPVAWNNTTLSANAADFLTFFNAHKSKSNYILGFSYGAVIAFMSANQTNPKELLLCSLSPDFKEDSEAMPQWLKRYIGSKRYADTKTRSARTIAKKITAKLVLLYGEQEGAKYPQIKKRTEEVAKLAPNSKLFVVPSAPHDISYPTYQTAIHTCIQNWQ